MPSFTIGALARSANVSVETIRYYERRGLLEQPARGTGYRQYPEADLDRLAFVRRAKALGFSLAEIRELLGGATSRSTQDVLRAARAKLAQVDDDLHHLTLRRCRLTRLVEACEDGSNDCVALDVAPPDAPARPSAYGPA